MRYRVNPYANVSYISGAGIPTSISTARFVEAIQETHAFIDGINTPEINVSSILGLRNLSSFIGEVYAASLIKVTGGDYKKNPHQDGYPDLLLMDGNGIKMWETLESQGRLRDKNPFSPFPNGGVEVKATCGDVPTDAKCRLRGAPGKPGIGDQRIDLLYQYVWKAHHRDTNNLVGLLWDFVGSAPRVVAVFFSAALTINDWRAIVLPQAGGGRTTSVSSMEKTGIKKMYSNWIAIYDEDPRYADFINAVNGGGLI